MKFIRRESKLSEDVQIQEIEERHNLSQQVFFRREAHGLSQESLAELAGMTQAQIANLEAGQLNPTLRTLVKLAHALECTTCEMMHEYDEGDARVVLDPAGAMIQASAHIPSTLFGGMSPFPQVPVGSVRILTIPVNVGEGWIVRDGICERRASEQAQSIWRTRKESQTERISA